MMLGAKPLARRVCSRWALGLLALSLGAVPLPAQGVAVAPLAIPGSEGERTARLRALVGTDSAQFSLLRSTSASVAALASSRDTIVLMSPELRVTNNSAHPWGGNDGLLRAGQGTSTQLSWGLALRFRQISAVALPQLAREQNGDFQTLPYPQPLSPVRNVWANPFYKPGNSMDYPQRFGDEARSALRLQGRVALDLHPAVRIGVGDESRWWGPGIDNGLLLSANAPSIPQVFIESPAPIRSRIGSFEYAYFLGRLRESEFFDFDTTNNQRSLSAATLVWTPPAALATFPSIGIARGVMAARAPEVGTALDFLRDVGRPWSRPADTLQRREQITSVFASWRVPSAGVEAWTEWVRYELPASLREFLEQPGHAQGYTLGVQWARPWRSGVLQLASEFTYTEPSPSIRVRPVKTSYTGSTMPQGWTHEGQMLGPWIGPAASSQLATVDYRNSRWRAGLTLGRLRRDANYRFVVPAGFQREDLQLYGGIRAGRRLGAQFVLLEFTDGVRLNHLYQAYDLGGPSGNETEGVDLRNRTLTLTVMRHWDVRAR